MQKIKCRKFAQQQGWRVVMEKAEKGISGSKVSASKRDVIQELRQEAGNGSFDILLVYMFDRLGRIESETPFVLEWFVQHGIQMWSVHEGQQRIDCYQRGQKLRACDGQSLYLAERVDAVVLEVVHDIFRRIQQEPYDRSIEQKLRQENGERERQKQAAEKKIKAAQYKQKRYEDEVIRCLDGQSRFSEEMLARLIAEAETEVRQAKEEYAELLRNDTTRATIQQIRSYYDEFLGWANEFDLATIPRKRAILGQLIEKVEVGKGYKVTVHLRMSYAQFLGIEGNGEIQVRKDVCA